MRLLHLIGIVVFSAASLALAAGTPPVRSLVPNGNFETATKSADWPDGWARAKSGSSWQEEGGNHFLRLSSSKPGETVLLYQPVTIPAGVAALELTWRQRVTGLKPGKQPWFDARIMMEFKDATGAKLPGAPAAPNTRKSSDGWVERSASFLVPADARTLEFMPALFQVESGTFDLDDISLKPTAPAPLEEKARVTEAARLAKQEKDAAARRTQAAGALAKSGSLLSNGDFETDAKKADGWPDDWSQPKGASWELEAGNRFLRLASSAPGQTVLLHRIVSLPEAKALELTWRQRVTGLKPGKEPWFDARILMDFKDAAGKKLKGAPAPATRADTKGWVERKVAFLVPEGAVTLEFMPALFQVERGTFDLDDFVLKPTAAEPLLAAAKANEAARKAAEVAPEPPQPAKWPQELHVEGTQVLTKDGKATWLQGVNVVSLEWSAEGEQVMKAALVATEQWRANIIRLPVAPKWWFGRGPGQKDGGSAYRQRVEEVVTLVANRGKYLLLDLHQFGAPRQEHAEFWQDAAAKFKNHPAVLFDLFNEPHGMSWEVWRNGGEVAVKKKPGEEDAFLSAEEKARIAETRRSIGMQRLLDTVRAAGARNVVLVGGLDYAYDLSGIAEGFALAEKGGNGIILSTHIYPWKKGWAEKVLVVADKYPILVGEVGAGAKKMEWLPAEYQEDAVTWVPEMIGFIQKHKFHWTAFAFHPKAGPPMLEDWSYTPNVTWGVPVKRALAGESFELKKLR